MEGGASNHLSALSPSVEVERSLRLREYVRISGDDSDSLTQEMGDSGERKEFFPTVILRSLSQHTKFVIFRKVT